MVPASAPKRCSKERARAERTGNTSWVWKAGSTWCAKERQRTRSSVIRDCFLESWAYVSDGARGHFGRSGSIELPVALAHEVLENGVELSIAIDRFAGAVGIRDAQGAWGVLSNNFITRQEAFRVAVIAAFAPFYNAKMYHAAVVGASDAFR
ncbi:MAG: hypothetical protein DMG41_38170 [Acidobacteria bacterium]|nr:MAG: hypothetical protein DMG41_38170 [Acidobacteriota bacterium]